jgi:hypothetical protein
MKVVVAAIASVSVLMLAGSATDLRSAQLARRTAQDSPPVATRPVRLASFEHALPTPAPRAARSAPTIPAAVLTAVVKQTCAAACHSDQRKLGDLSLANFDVAKATASPDVAEKMIAKLRAGMMPPPGRRRPEGDTLPQLASTLETLLDRAAAANPEPGGRTFQRLNRAEYERSILDLLGMDVSAGSWLPLDTKSANFDNIADVQMPSATTLDAYLDAAS